MRRSVSVPSRFAGDSASQWYACPQNEDTATALKRHLRITGQTAPDVILHAPVVNNRTGAVHIGKEVFDKRWLCINEESFKQMQERYQRGAAALPLLLIAFGFTPEEMKAEEQTGCTAELRGLAAAVGVPLVVVWCATASDVEQQLQLHPTHAVWMVAHGSDDGSYGPLSRAELVQLLDGISDSTECITTVVLFACSIAQALLDDVRQLCWTNERPLPFHLVAFHDVIYRDNRQIGELIRALFVRGAVKTPEVKAQRLDIQQRFDNHGAKALAEQGFLDLSKLGVVEQALVLATVYIAPLHKSAAASALVPVIDFVPCSVYIPWIGNYGRVIGEGAAVDDFLTSCA